MFVPIEQDEKYYLVNVYGNVINYWKYVHKYTLSVHGSCKKQPYKYDPGYL